MKKSMPQFKKWGSVIASILLLLSGAGTLNAQVYFTENFSSASGTTMPTGWTNLAGPNFPSSGLWDADNPAARTITGAAFSGKFVILDSYSLCADEDAILTTPAINLSSSTTPFIKFSESYRAFGGQSGTVQYSINGGTWTTIATRNATNNVGYPNPVTVTSIPVPAIAGQANVRFRWTFEGECGWWWAIDNVEVGELGDPLIITNPATNITTSAATLNANITASGGSVISRSGILLSYTTNPLLGDVGVVDSLTNPVVTSGSFALNFRGLIPGQAYYFRSYAVNTTDTGYGLSGTFTVNSSAVAPYVLPVSASNIGTTAATIGGNITADGGDAVFASGMVYGTTPNPQMGDIGVKDTATNPAVLSGIYHFNITGLSHNTKYYYRAYATNNVGTTYSTIDSFNTEQIFSSFPYSENFDGASTPWVSSAQNGGTNDWQLGTPAKSTIVGAASAPNAFVTKLTANYSLTSECAVTSPSFNFSAQIADPILRFKHIFDEDQDPGYDGGVIQISVNGNMWTTLDDNAGTGANFNTPNSSAWYNDNSGGNAAGFINTFSGLSSDYASATNGWITSTTTLVGAAGASDVRVRFYFAADDYTDEGWAIDDVEIFIPVAPSVTTQLATNITLTTATLGGNITGNGMSNITASGVVYGSSLNPTVGDLAVVDSTTNPLVAMGVFTKNIAGLTSSTVYHYRAYAINAVDTSYGADNTFTTNGAATAPTVSSTVQNVRATKATINGNITSDGGDNVTASGIVYSTLTNPVIGGSSVVDSITTNPFVAIGQYGFMLTGLAPNTKYYFKAYAINSIGTSYSTIDSFTTEPIVSSLPYTENFDSVNTPWKTAAINGGVNDWVLGTPGKVYLNAAYSGNNAWVTKLTGNHSRGADGVVESPQFDFSSLSSDPILTFSNKFLTEFGDGGMNVEISINDGPYVTLDDNVGNYQTYNTFNGSLAWYDTEWGVGNIIGAYFSGPSDEHDPNTNGWIRSSTFLTGAAGASNVRIRMRFSSWSASWTNLNEGFVFDDVSIVADVAPTVLTLAAANTSTTETTLSGNITANGRTAITASGIVLGTSANPVLGDVGVVDSTTNPLITEGIYTLGFNGLPLATTYHYRAYAINNVDTSYGADMTVTTLATPIAPTVITKPFSNLSETSVTLNAQITSNGGEPVFASGIVYSLHTNPAIGDISTVDSATTNPIVTKGNYSFTIIGLMHSTKYYYRSYAVNNIGTSYSALDSFTTALIITTLPYAQNFEAGTAGWINKTIGVNNSWVLGTPNKPFINGAHSGLYTWVTKLTGNYDNNHDAAVVSPSFDFSTYTSNPILRFYHKFITETNYDAYSIEISTNGGTVWTKLDRYIGNGSNYITDSSYSWYNNTSTSGRMAPPKFSSLNEDEGSNFIFENQSNGWIQSATILTGSAGQSNVKFRFRFSSDGSNNEEGLAIDDIEVVEAPLSPSNAASSVVSSGVGGTNATIGWTNGNGTGRLLVGHLTTTPAIAPANYKMYKANTVFGSMDSTGVGNYVLSANTNSSVVATGLAEYTDYTFDVYEYNGKYMHLNYTTAASNNVSTLPVTFISFTATVKGDNTLLNWSTATETNNSGFEIERSTDGRNFEKVIFVKGAGNSKKVTNYDLIDAKAFATSKSNMLYYRLKQVDFDGKYTYSKVVRVSKTDESIKEVSVLPNPYSTEYNLLFTASEEGNATIQMMDIQGKLVATKIAPVIAGSNNIAIQETAALNAGVYFVRITLNGETQTLKLVKN